jgi:GTP-dependent phosphoenolpyruvate carboxykinase
MTKLTEAKAWLGDIKIILTKTTDPIIVEHVKEKIEVLEWLINRVEELEEEIETWEIGFGMLDRIKEYFEEKSRDLERENHHLKQTLSYYANPAIYDSRHGMEILRDSGDKARRELEGDESDTKEVDRRR